MYLEGRGTSKDPAAAYMWLFLAEHTVQHLLRNCTALKSQVAAQITEEERFAAETRAASRMASGNPAGDAACTAAHSEQPCAAPQPPARNRRLASAA
jgi:hypothetical protein